MLPTGPITASAVHADITDIYISRKTQVKVQQEVCSCGVADGMD